MNGRKAFFISFFISMIGVAVIYGSMWGMIQGKTRETDTPQPGIAKTVPGVNDSKTLLLGLGEGENPYFFVIKLSAITNRIGIGCISGQYEFSDGKTLAKSLKSAGIMQCLLDIEEEFDVKIDHYIYCSWQQAALLAKDMANINTDSLGEKLPPVIKDFLLSGAEKLAADTLINCRQKAAAFLDNEIGLAFLTETMAQLIMASSTNLADITENIKDNYSDIYTNLNTTSLAQLQRICQFLAVSHIEYPRRVIVKGQPEAAEKIRMIME